MGKGLGKACLCQYLAMVKGGGGRGKGGGGTCPQNFQHPKVPFKYEVSFSK